MTTRSVMDTERGSDVVKMRRPPIAVVLGVVSWTSALMPDDSEPAMEWSWSPRPANAMRLHSRGVSE
jgi:hypothetical protein